MNYSKQRSLILSIVKSNPVHPTADWVFQEAKKKIPTIGIATVYRNLNALVELGEIDRLKSSDGVDRFDGNLGEHYHLQCTECGKLYDLMAKDAESVDALRKQINNTFNIADNNVVISRTLLSGICNECKDANHN